MTRKLDSFPTVASLPLGRHQPNAGNWLEFHILGFPAKPPSLSFLPCREFYLEQAVSYLEHQISIARKLNDQQVEAASGLGCVYQQMGDHSQALDDLRLAEETGSSGGQSSSQLSSVS